jgi:hypothetical protein
MSALSEALQSIASSRPDLDAVANFRSEKISGVVTQDQAAAP